MRNEGGGGRRMEFLVFGSWKIRNGNEKRGSSSLFSLFLVSLALFYRPRVTRIFRIYSINVCGPRIYTLHEENARNASSVPGITSPPLHHLPPVEGKKEGRKEKSFSFSLDTRDIIPRIYDDRVKINHSSSPSFFQKRLLRLTPLKIIIIIIITLHPFQNWIGGNNNRRRAIKSKVTFQEESSRELAHLTSPPPPLPFILHPKRSMFLLEIRMYVSFHFIFSFSVLFLSPPLLSSLFRVRRQTQVAIISTLFCLVINKIVSSFSTKTRVKINFSQFP